MRAVGCSFNGNRLLRGKGGAAGGGGEQQEEIQQLINNTKPLTKKVCAGGVAISKGKGNIYYGHGLTVHTPSSATHTHTEIH